MARKNYLLPLSALFLLLTLVRCWTLPGNTPIGRLLLPVSFLALAAMAVWLLLWEGCAPRAAASALLPLTLALFLRSLLLPHATLDYQDFLSQWVDFFRQNDGFAALKFPIGNYNVPYLYFLAFISQIPAPDLYLIKVVSILFDLVLAWGGLRLAKCISSNEKAPVYAFVSLFLLPTVILNGACWAQCDSVWAALCLHALASALDHKPKSSLALLALAFSFKLQAIFILPLWLALWFTKRIKFHHFFVFPAAFSLIMLPAVLLGKPVRDILSVYIDQASDSIGWQTVNYNSPSIFTLLPHQLQLPYWAPRLFILLAFLFMLAILLLLFIRRKAADGAALTLAGAALSLGIPFLLPYMHERYFFLGGVLLVVWACISPPQLPSAAAAELASLGGYHAYLMKRYVMAFTILGFTWTQLIEGLLMLFAILATLSSLWSRLSAPPSCPKYAGEEGP